MLEKLAKCLKETIIEKKSLNVSFGTYKLRMNIFALNIDDFFGGNVKKTDFILHKQYGIYSR